MKVNTAKGPIALQEGATIKVTYPNTAFETGDDVDAFEGWLIGCGAGPSDTEVFNYIGRLEDKVHAYAAANQISEKRLMKIVVDGKKLGVRVEVLEL